MNFCIFGAGAWGTAMAIRLARSEHTVTLVPRRMEHAMALSSDRENKTYLPGIPFPAELQIGMEIKPSVMEADVILLACPSKGIRGLCEEIKPHLGDAWGMKLFLTLSKGLEQSTLLRPAEVVQEVIPECTCGTLTGPAYAKEVAAGKPTALLLACKQNIGFAQQVQEAISSQQIRVYFSEDLSGAELGACLKNVYAVGAGISDGLSLGDNSRAAYLTRVLHEMVLLGASLGGKVATFYGLSGFGDLVATCQGKWSRNRTFGEKNAQGASIEELTNSNNY